MIATGDIWSAQRWPPGWTVRRVEATGSTNSDLLAAAVDGTARPRTALVADHQLEGRGRLGRRWEAPPGANLLVSLLFDGGSASPSAHPAEPMQRVAVAAYRALDRLVPGLAVAVKWPNDLVVDDRKLAGMLAERSGPHVVVGLGCNVSWSPEGAVDLGGAVTPAALLAALLAELDALPDDVDDAYRRRLATVGRSVRATLPGGAEVVGIAEDVDAAGRLIVATADGDRRALDAADVVHLRPADS